MVQPRAGDLHTSGDLCAARGMGNSRLQYGYGVIDMNRKRSSGDKNKGEEKISASLPPGIEPGSRALLDDKLTY